MTAIPIRIALRGALLGLALLTAAWLCPSVTASPPAPPTEPFPRIEAGMHTAPIIRIATDRAGRWLVTASLDKTARVWDLSTGALAQILRPPIGPGQEGKLYSCALSPDGETVAVAGWTGYDWDGSDSIYLFERRSGALKGRITGLPQVVNHLAYSGDGRYLAVALGKNGIRVFDTRGQFSPCRDTDFGNGSYWVEFDRSGRVVATSLDGELRLYGPPPAFPLLARKTAPGGKEPLAARFSPDKSPGGRRIAVGFTDSTTVNVLSGDDLSFLYSADTAGVDTGDLSIVAWSSDGTRLHAAGRYRNKTGRRLLVTWPANEKGHPERLPLTGDKIMDLTSLPDGRLAFGAADPAWGIVAGGKVVSAQRPPIPDQRGFDVDFRLSRDASLVEFMLNSWSSSAWESRRVRFDVERRELTVDATSAPDLTPPRTEGPPTIVWNGTYTPTLDGRPVPLKTKEKSHSLAMAADGSRFLLGTEWHLRLFDLDGRELWNPPVPVPGVAWLVNLAPDGRLATAAFADGTVRWYRVADGAEQLALFVHPDGKRWVAWTPEGFFDAGGGGESLMGWHLNRGRDQAAEFIGSDQLFEVFYRPDIVARRLRPEGEDEARRTLTGVGDVRQVLAGGLPPKVELLSPAEVESEDGEVEIEVRVTDRGGGIGRLRYLVGDREIEGRSIGIGIPGKDPVKTVISVPGKEQKIRVSAFDRTGRIESRVATVAATVRESGIKPVLHVLAIGITDYGDETMNLKYAAADAESLTIDLKVRGKGLFRDVLVTPPLYNREATLTRIKEEFEKLAKQVKPDDVFVLFLAGHGQLRSGEEYVFLLPPDPKGPSRELTGATIRKLLAKIKAKDLLVMLDTCHAGAFSLPELESALDRSFKRAGRAFLAAASSRQIALEGYKGHGIFSYAVLDALQNAYDGNKDGNIDVDELSMHVMNTVPEIARTVFKQKQDAVRGLQGNRFALTRVRR